MKTLSPSQAIAFFAAVVTAGPMIGGCGDNVSGIGALCPKDPPTDCPSPAPRYTAHVAPVIQTRCAQCHTPGGIQEFVPFQTYEQVQLWQVGIKVVLESCLMPPADQPQPTSEEWSAMLGWIACGAMND
jgi:mono/diheme cytochrome c family protein